MSDKVDKWLPRVYSTNFSHMSEHKCYVPLTDYNRCVKMIQYYANGQISLAELTGSIPLLKDKASRLFP